MSTPSRPRPPGRPRSAQAEQAITSATLKLLMDQGYAGVTVDKVASLAKASKATIYRRWPTKEHLIVAALGQMPGLTPGDHGDITADLLALFEQYTRITRVPHLRSVLPMVAAQCADHPDLAVLLETFNEQRRVPLRIVLRRAIKRGELAEDVDIDFAVDALQSAIALRVFFVAEELTPAWMRKIIMFTLVGLGARPYLKT